MIYQSYVHYFCRLVKMFRQPIILCTRSHTAGRMVVTKCHGNGPFQQCFPQYTTDIHRCRGQSSGTYLYTVNYFGSLVQVFTDVRYTKKDSEAMSENLWKVMKEQGFPDGNVV